MKPIELINSGLLELYAFDACSADEKTLVENMLVQYPEVKAELLKINQSIENIALSNAVEPPVKLKNKIKDQLTFNNAESKTDIGSKQNFAKIITFYKLGIAASLIVASITGFLAVNYKNQLNNTNQKLAELTNQNILFSENINRANFKMDDMQKQMAVLKNPEFKSVKLSATEKFPSSELMVYWNPKSKETFISINSLPTLPEGMQFQLWALVDGKPIDAGVFLNNTNQSMIAVKETADAQMFAVTIEKMGGSQVPTIEQMVVAGKI